MYYKSNNSIIARMHPRWRCFAGMTFQDQLRALQDFYERLGDDGITKNQKIAYALDDGMRTLDIDFHNQLLLARKIMERNILQNMLSEKILMELIIVCSPTSIKMDKMTF